MAGRALLGLCLIVQLAGCSEPADRAPDAAAAPSPAGRSAYFGDLHVHTFHSFDALSVGTRATPDDAYRYARGEAIRHPAGFEVQLDRPLDFYAVTDHAAVRSAWQDVQAAAERHNDPGRFTTFIAYEYPAAADQQYLHRNVIFRGSRVPAMPFSHLDSMNPEALWRWMDNLRDRGIESLAIPHDANGSNGRMFARTDGAGDPLDAAYAERRRRNEPLAEITQSVREALGNGIAMEAADGFNPYQFGVVGAGDRHTGAASPDEESYFDTWGASGLTGIWAEDNDRAALYDALRRKETFATSGPRLVVWLFGGFGLADDLHADPQWIASAYDHAVPMGGDLLPGNGVPRLVATALKDPRGAPLQRLQIVKGWVAGGEPRERVYDIACADGLQVDPETHRCPDNGAEVDLETCAVRAGVGDAELATTWQDPDFQPDQEAFYYLRVLQNPTCRRSTWDAVREGVAPRHDLPPTIQERAWSSPIWYHGSVLP